MPTPDVFDTSDAAASSSSRRAPILQHVAALHHSAGVISRNRRSMDPRRFSACGSEIGTRPHRASASLIVGARFMHRKICVLFLSILVVSAGCRAGDGSSAGEARRMPVVKAPSELNPPGGSDAAAIAEPTGAITLRDALALAISRNPELGVFPYELRAADARKLQAGLRPNPELGDRDRGVRRQRRPQRFRRGRDDRSSRSIHRARRQTSASAPAWRSSTRN